MTNKEIKREAKARLSGNWKIAILNLFVVGVLTTIINEVLLGVTGIGGGFADIMSSISDPYAIKAETISPAASIFASFGSIAVSFISAVFAVGYDWALLDMVDGEKLTVEGIFQAANSKRFFKVIGISIVTGLFVFFWSLLLVIPGIVKAYSYSQAYNIYKDDPEVDVVGAINRSKELMKGKKWKFFILQFSFIVWYLIPVALFLAFIFGSVNTIRYQFQEVSIYANDEFVGFLLGMLLVVLAFGLAMFLISLYVEPYRKTAAQIFYRDLVGYPELGGDEGIYEEQKTYATEQIDPYEETEESSSSDDRLDRF